MLKITTTLIIFLMGILAQAQVTEKRTVNAVSAVEVKNGIELIYSQSDNQLLTAESNNSTGLANLITEVKNGTLKIYLKDAGLLNRENTVKVYLSAPNLESMTATSEAKITAPESITNEKRITISLQNGGQFRGTIRSKGTVTINTGSDAIYNGRVETARFYGNFKANSKINVSGTADKAVINAHDKSFCSARNLVAQDVAVSADQDASVFIFVNTYINVNVNELGKVVYFGYPETVKLNENAAATVRKITRSARIASSN